MKGYKMKNLILILSLFATTVFAQERVPSVWAFNISNTQGSYFRATLLEANRIQNKYEFIVEHKPGAGGEVAAGYALDKKGVVLRRVTFQNVQINKLAGYALDWASANIMENLQADFIYDYFIDEYIDNNFTINPPLVSGY